MKTPSQKPSSSPGCKTISSLGGEEHLNQEQQLKELMENTNTELLTACVVSKEAQ
jgi:hypothetical protein